MLKPLNTNNQGWAWLLDQASSRCLKLERRSNAPPPAGLAFFAPDFSLQTSEPWLIGEESDFPAFERQPLPPLQHKAEPSSADFARVCEDILLRIGVGEFEKVVPMVCEEFEFAAPLRRAMFRAPILPYQFAYGFEFLTEGMAGVTPELLFEVEGDQLTTMALAGTGRTEGPSLLDDRKEMHEHRLVIEHILSELKIFGSVQVEATIERVYGPLKHLFTPIRLRLNREPQFAELITHLHPTAALGGWPRKPAVQWLEQQPFHMQRARFGAPFGWVEGARMKCVVAIRNVQWWGQRLMVSSGCGVVAESQPLKEWKELELKRQAIFRLLEVQA